VPTGGAWPERSSQRHNLDGSRAAELTADEKAKARKLIAKLKQMNAAKRAQIARH
jgi:hypothetical protein